MTQTNIEYFNSTLKLFINDIIKIYPEYHDSLNEYYKELLEKDSCNDDKYIKRFIRKFSEIKEDIANKNDGLFKESVCLLKNVDFKEIWINTISTQNIKNTIWNYLQTLFVIGETIMSDTNKIKSMVDNLQKKRNNECTDSSCNETENEENKDLMGMLQNLSNDTSSQPINNDLLSNGLIGNLAKELASEINMDDLNLNLDSDNGNVGDIFSKLMSGDNPMKFMNLIQNVGQKIQSKLSDGGIDQSKLLDEAQGMMGMLGNNNPLFDNLLNKAKNEMKDANHPTNPSYNNPTRDRLRKKMEQRKKK